MKLQEIYDLAIKKSFKEDPRSKKHVDEQIKKTKEEYSKARKIEKKTFDKERLKHPYSDTRILHGDKNAEISSVMVGIDIGPGELILADRLREKGAPVDLVISHHPSGRALAQLPEVMEMQPGLWQKHGFTKDVAEGLMKSRVGEVFRGLSPSNNTRALDVAKTLGIPFMCIHTPADNCVTSYLDRLFEKKKPKQLRRIISILQDIPEYRGAMENGTGPFILIGDEKDEVGKIFIDMTGGTSGPKTVYSRLSQSGVKTVVGMHCKESSYKTAKGQYINYVIAGHISSDNLGLNLLFDYVEKSEKLNFINVSGFKRVRR